MLYRCGILMDSTPEILGYCMLKCCELICELLCQKHRRLLINEVDHQKETPRPESKQSKMADNADLITQITLIATSVKEIKEGQEGMKRMFKSKIDTLRNDVLSTTDDKKGKRKAQGVPQPQTAAPPRPQEEQETDKSKPAQIEQTYEKHQD